MTTWYQRFDVNGRGGRVSMRRNVNPTSAQTPPFQVYRKKPDGIGSRFIPTNEFLPPELEEFMGNLMRAQDYYVPGQARPMTTLYYEDLIELYEDMRKAAQLLRNLYKPIDLFRTTLQKLGHKYVAGTEKLPHP